MSTHPISSNNPVTISAKEAAELLGCSERTIARMCEAGKLKACRAGNRWRVNRAALLAYIGEAE